MLIVGRSLSYINIKQHLKAFLFESTYSLLVPVLSWLSAKWYSGQWFSILLHVGITGGALKNTDGWDFSQRFWLVGLGKSVAWLLIAFKASKVILTQRAKVESSTLGHAIISFPIISSSRISAPESPRLASFIQHLPFLSNVDRSSSSNLSSLRTGPMSLHLFLYV